MLANHSTWPCVTVPQSSVLKDRNCKLSPCTCISCLGDFRNCINDNIKQLDSNFYLPSFVWTLSSKHVTISMKNRDGNSTVWVKLVSDSARNIREQGGDPSSGCIDWEGPVRNSRLLAEVRWFLIQCQTVLSNVPPSSWGGREESLSLPVKCIKTMVLEGHSCSLLSLWDSYHYRACSSGKSVIRF